MTIGPPLLGVLLTTLLGFAVTEGVDVGLLSHRSFSIRTSQACYSSANGSQKIYNKVQELYSQEQLRTRIIYNSISEVNLFKSLVYDLNLGRGLVLDYKSHSCKVLKLTDIGEQLCNFHLVVEHLEELLSSSLDKGFDHIVGPARILLLISQLDSNYFVRLDDVTVQNSIGYRLNLPSSNNLAMNIYYSLTDLDPTKSDPPFDQVPLKITASITGPQVLVASFSYYEYKPLANAFLGLSSAKHQGLDLSNTQTMLDDFLFPISHQCSFYLREPQGGSNGDFRPLPSLLSGYPHPDILQLTFFAESDQLNNFRLYKHFVAYDGFLETIRIDSKKVSLKTINKVRDSLQILNLNSNRHYMITDTSDSASERLKSQVGLSPDSVGNTACSVTYFGTPGISLTPLNIETFLFGHDQFVYMGRARVRGINALVYEGLSKHLPEWLSQPMLYKDTASGSYKRREIGRVIEKLLMGQKPLSLCTLVYLTADSEIKLPLQLEIYDMNIASSSSYRRILKVDFVKFQLDLDHAPDGTHMNSLFKIADECSFSRPAELYSDVNLVLTLDESPGDKTMEKQLLLGHKSIVGQHALMSGIASTLSIQPTMMFDFSSRLINDFQTLSVDFRLADHPTILMAISFVGNADIEFASDDIVRVRSLTPMECLWILEGLPVVEVYMHYSEQARVCLFEGAALKGERISLESSKVFKLKETSRGELFKIDLKPDERMKNNNRLKTQNSIHYHGSPVIVPQWQPDIYHESQELTMKIDHLRVKENNQIADSSDEATEASGDVVRIRGFSLVPEESRQPDRCQPADGLDKFLTLDRCRAACMLDLNCRWYSYCRRGYSTCLLSSSEADPVELDEELRRFKADTKEIGTGRRRRYKSDAISLDADSLCELRPKRDIDFFWKSYDVLSQIGYLSIVPSDIGLEKCAKLCLETDVDIIKKHSESGSASEKDPTELYCSSFLFLEHPTNQEQADLLQRMTGGELAPSYCLFDHLGEPMRNITSTGITFRLESYRFDYTRLFSKKVGYHLIASERTPEEDAAYRRVVLNDESVNLGKDVATQILTRAVESGSNFQRSIQTSELTCAMRCFLQTTGLELACVSFDVINTGQGTLCTFNTLSLADAIKNNLVARDQAKTQHFSLEMDLLRSVSTRRIFSRKDAEESARSDPVSSAHLGSMLIRALLVVLSSLTGLYLAFFISARFAANRGTNQADLSKLIGLSKIDG